MVLKMKICVHGTHPGVYPVSMIPVIFFLIIIILEPQTSIITSVIIIFFNYSVTLHTDLWKLAPCFKKEKEKKSLLLYCMLQKNYRLWNAV